MSGILYVVGTPIGNLNDLTYRAGKTLEEADFLAVEDTRVTVKLLNHLGLKKSMVSYHEHNMEEQGPRLIGRILAGESCALCCDAGTPGISDPGQVLVRQAHEAGIRVVPIPGPSAFVCALSAGGQPTGRFVFEGFISVNRKQRQERLEELKKETRTMVVYEAPHKLLSTLKDLCAVFGADRPVTIAREITKVHEEIFVTTLGQAVQKYEQENPKGEFVLLVGGSRSAPPEPLPTKEDAVQRALDLIAQGTAPTAACKQAAAEAGLGKSELYRLVQARREEM